MVAKIGSKKTLFRNEVKNIKATFKAKGYPSWFFNKLVQQFHCHNVSNQSSFDTDQTSSKSTHEYVLIIPYFGKDSGQLFNKF